MLIINTSHDEALLTNRYVKYNVPILYEWQPVSSASPLPPTKPSRNPRRTAAIPPGLEMWFVDLPQTKASQILGVATGSHVKPNGDLSINGGTISNHPSS